MTSAFAAMLFSFANFLLLCVFGQSHKKFAENQKKILAELNQLKSGTSEG